MVRVGLSGMITLKQRSEHNELLTCRASVGVVEYFVSSIQCTVEYDVCGICVSGPCIYDRSE